MYWKQALMQKALLTNSGGFVLFTKVAWALLRRLPLVLHSLERRTSSVAPAALLQQDKQTERICHSDRCVELLVFFGQTWPDAWLGQMDKLVCSQKCT